MDRAYGFAAFCFVVGLSFILCRRWWVRERTDFLRRAVTVVIGDRIRQRAEARARWYETNPAEAERRAVYIGLAYVIVGAVVLLVQWIRSG